MKLSFITEEEPALWEQEVRVSEERTVFKMSLSPINGQNMLGIELYPTFLFKGDGTSR